MKPNPYPGKFIAFEGIDGCGKSTQAKLFVDFLNSIGQKAVLSFEHTREGEWGTKIEQVQRKEMPAPKSPAEFQEWYIKDRLYHLVKTVIPALGQGYSVVTDRYWLSTLAYGMAAGVKKELLIKMHEDILKEHFILPDITFIIDVPVEIAVGRMNLRKEEKSIFDKKSDFQKKVRLDYLILTNDLEDINVINGNQLVEEVSKDVKDVYLEKIV